MICQGQRDGGTGYLAGKVTSVTVICRRGCRVHVDAGFVAGVMALAACVMLRGCAINGSRRGGRLTALMLPRREAGRQNQYQR